MATTINKKIKNFDITFIKYPYGFYYLKLLFPLMVLKVVRILCQSKKHLKNKVIGLLGGDLCGRK